MPVPVTSTNAVVMASGVYPVSRARISVIPRGRLASSYPHTFRYEHINQTQLHNVRLFTYNTGPQQAIVINMF